MNEKPKFQLPNFDDGAGKKSRAPSPTLRLLEQTRLSKLLPPPRREPCANCGGRLDPGDEYQTSVKLCRECLRNYANIGEILIKHADQKIRRNYLGR